MKRLIPLILLLLASVATYATHNRAGEIVYSHISGTTYQITVNIFSDPTSPAFQRKEIVIDWGDNTDRDSITQTIVYPKLTDNIQKRSWIVRHTYPGPGNYTISVTDPNRSGDVDNITNPSGVPFYIECLLRISPLGSLKNNSPVLLNDPIDNACAGQIFIHNPGAVDPDGDSLAYELAPSYADRGIIAPGYEYPPSSNPIYVDARSGDLVMNVPFAVGLFNVSIRIKEYRNNVLIGSVLRDLQIQVYPGCNNNAPVISANSQYCVEAGRQLSFTVTASDPDPSDDVRLSATGEPLVVSSNPANFSQTVVGNPSSATFIWNTNCGNARKKLYDLSIKGEDNAIDHRNASTNLTTFKSVVIRVIAPGPENATAQKSGTGIQLNWDNIACPNASGFKIYRRIDSSGYQSSNCIPGVPEGIGYELIETIPTVSLTNYLDDNKGDGLVPERKYCYLITKYFDDGDESYVSNEVCAEIDKIIPIMTKVSISQTDLQNGQALLSWSPPDTIDQTMFPPPYRYVLERRRQGRVEVIDSTNSLSDTSYTLSNVNTFSSAIEVRVVLISLGNGRTFAGKSPWASSVFLSLTPSDNQVTLNWLEDIPWINSQYTIFRKKPFSAQFDSLTTIDSNYYVDKNLVNLEEYCYYVKTYGAYESNSVDSPLVNLSQISCSVPLDNIPPCPPNFSIQGDCEFKEMTISWASPNTVCDSDLVGFRIYRSPFIESEFEMIEQINDPNTNSYRMNGSISGCYYVAAIDSVGNESRFSSKECIEYCPIYELPNVFTPNGDGINDLFVPKPDYRYVDSVDFQVYNRWDQMIFRTNEPDINWNGLNADSDELVSDGIYFYICRIWVLTLDGPEEKLLKGTISVINSKKAQNFK